MHLKYVEVTMLAFVVHENMKLGDNTFRQKISVS